MYLINIKWCGFREVCFEVFLKIYLLFKDIFCKNERYIKKYLNICVIILFEFILNLII